MMMVIKIDYHYKYWKKTIKFVDFMEMQIFLIWVVYSLHIFRRCIFVLTSKFSKWAGDDPKTLLEILSRSTVFEVQSEMSDTVKRWKEIDWGTILCWNVYEMNRITVLEHETVSERAIDQFMHSIVMPLGIENQDKVVLLREKQLFHREHGTLAQGR